VTAQACAGPIAAAKNNAGSVAFMVAAVRVPQMLGIEGPNEALGRDALEKKTAQQLWPALVSGVSCPLEALFLDAQTNIATAPLTAAGVLAVKIDRRLRVSSQRLAIAGLNAPPAGGVPFLALRTIPAR